MFNLPRCNHNELTVPLKCLKRNGTHSTWSDIPPSHQHFGIWKWHTLHRGIFTWRTSHTCQVVVNIGLHDRTWHTWDISAIRGPHHLFHPSATWTLHTMTSSISLTLSVQHTICSEHDMKMAHINQRHLWTLDYIVDRSSWIRYHRTRLSKMAQLRHFCTPWITTTFSIHPSTIESHTGKILQSLSFRSCRRC